MFTCERLWLSVWVPIIQVYVCDLKICLINVNVKDFNKESPRKGEVNNKKQTTRGYKVLVFDS